MEATEIIIARLVLGYLKEEKCRTAYKEFLTTSPHLQSDLVTKAKYFPTRFVGLTLADILCEYFELSKIVQGRLEATNYYNECHSRSSLVQQLLYLLSKGQSSRTSTPCPRSPVESNLGETSPSHIDHVSDVETTPAHTLPGNIRCTSEDSYLYKTPRRKSNSKLNKTTTVSSLQITEKEDMSEVLANALLENREFHEKIAQTINKVAEKQYRVSSELDRTIKTVVKETEADPIFDKILEEIIGSTSAIENCKGIDTSSTASSTAKDTRDDLRNKSKRAQKRLSLEHSEQDLDQRLRIHSNSQTVEQQNDDAIRSIVANSNLSNPQESGQEIHVNNEVTVFNGSLDKYLTSNTCHANTQTQPLQNPLYINTSGSLLMVPSGIGSNGTLQIDSTKQYYLVNKQPAMNWNIPPIQTASIITEQDILAMPTVIVNDEKQNKIHTSESAIHTPILTTHPTLKAIAPKPTIEIPAEYLNVYGESDIHQQSGLKNVLYPKTTKQSRTKEKTTGTAPCQTVIEPNAVDIPKTTKLIPEVEHKQDEEDKTTTTSQSNNGEHFTPPPVVELVQKTPKSGSHIRNLDFSTPPKITSTHKKCLRNNHAGKKSPPFIHKKQAAKSLFNSQNGTPNDTDKTSRTWDADLRANIIPPGEEKSASNTAKKKKKTPIKKVKKKVKKIKAVRRKLNTTEQGAALIEAALKTPIKTNMFINSEPENDDKNENEPNEDVIKSENVSKNNDNSECQAKDFTECNTKTVLSPSKLNANKRKLIKSDITDTSNDLPKSEDETNKFITPEMAKENVHYPIKANRNITSMFDTPLKDEFVPKTPGSPSRNLNTPFTRMLEANLKGIDISSLPTPNIPATPNFPPYTPNVEVSSPYSNRPTDYSTSSSYYQPSDTEPNRSLEANVIELEKKAVTILSDITVPDNDQIENGEYKTDPVKPVNNIVDERLKIFNENIIGKKNLSLVKRNISPHSSSSDSSSENSNDEDNVDSCNWVDKSNDTIICNKKTPETPRRTYSLRNRTTTINKKEDTTKSVGIKESTVRHRNIKPKATSISNSSQKPQEPQICIKSETLIVTQSNCKDKLEIDEEGNDKKLIENSNFKEALKKELNEKLMRTKTKIKTIEKPTKKNVRKSTKTSKSKFMKIKMFSKNKKKEKSDESPKKIIEDRIANTENNQEDTNNVPQPKNKRKVGTDKKNIRNPISKNPEKIDKSASDIEAQNLIEGLKEREHKDVNNDSDALKGVTENKSTEENPHERSTTELETEWRETYDTILLKDHECVIFSESKRITKDYDTKVLDKTFIGKVFIEELNEDIEIPMEVTPFITLLDIPSSRNPPQKQRGANQRTKASDKNIDEKTNKNSTVKTETNKNSMSLPQNPISGDDQTNHANIGSSKEDKDGLEAPSTKKRKVEKEDSRVPEEKECKSLLQQINVDTFLNNIYGNG